MKKDLRQMFRLFLPIFLECFLITLLTSVDTLMLSRYDELCVDAVGTSNSTLSLLTILIIISANGVCITVGQFLGANKKEEARGVLSQGVFFNVCLGFILMLVFFFGNGWLLKLANTPDDFYELAKQYIRIYSIALPFQAVTQVIGSNFRAYGKPFYMTLVSIVSNLVNVLLNWLLIFGIGPFPELGIQGAAIATAASLIFKTICGILLNLFILKCPLIPRKIDFRILGMIVKIGGPGALESTAYTISQFILLAALNKLTVDEITSRVYINMALSYIYMFSSALGMANGVIVARHVGAHEYSKAKNVTWATTAIGLCIIVTLLSLLCIFAKPIFLLLSDNERLIPIITKVLPLAFFIEVGRCTNLCIIGAQKSSGDVLFPLVLAIIVMFVVQAFGAWCMAIWWGMGLAGIILAQGLDEFIRGIVSVFRWISNRWQNKSLIKD